jgi:hypothetical protein
MIHLVRVRSTTILGEWEIQLEFRAATTPHFSEERCKGCFLRHGSEHRFDGTTVHTQRVAPITTWVSRLTNKEVEINHFVVCRFVHEADRG